MKDSTGAALDLTGYTGRAQIRDAVDATRIFEFSIAITAATGTVDLTLPSSVSTGITAGTYIWDFQLTEPSGNVRTYIAGDVRVHDEVTR